MDNLIERLAKKWHHEVCCESDECDTDDKAVAIFFVNAIADELNESPGAAEYLRSQAGGDDE